MDARNTSVDNVQAFENLLNGIDAIIYVADIVTNEVLFLNNKLRSEYGLGGDYTGQKCWEVLHKEYENACELCPLNKLKVDMETPVIWEEQHKITGKYYKHHSTIIDWVGGKKAYMQHSVDITDTKRAERDLIRRLKQQELMSHIAQSFVVAGNEKQSMQKALVDVRDFWGADTVFIVRDFPEEKAAEVILSSGSLNGRDPLGLKASYDGKEDAYLEIVKSDGIACEDIAQIPDSRYIGQRLAAHFRRFIMPIFIKDAFYGFLEVVSYNMEDRWHKSDWHLGQLLSSVFSATLERGEREKKLFTAEQRLRVIIDNAPITIFWKDMNSVYQGGNALFAKTARLNTDEIVGKTDFDIVDEPYARKNLEDDRRVLETGEIFDAENYLTHGENKHWLHTIKAPIRDENGCPVGIVGLSENITERKKIESQLMKMSAIVDHSPQFISYTDRNGRFDYFNNGVIDVTGYSYGDLKGQGLGLFCDEETRLRLRDELLPEIYRQGKLNFELPFICKDGRVRNMAISTFVVEPAEGLCAAIATDITKRVQLEEDLKREKELAEQANAAKSEFLSRMSHEIRTPMNAIIGMTKIAMANQERVEYCLEKIDGASKHLLGILNDILDMSKIEAAKFVISEDEFNLEKMIVEAANIANFLAQEKEQTLEVKADPNLPAYVIGDELRLKQVITNLLSNAIKFTGRLGTVTLRITNTAKGENSSRICFEVQDTGIGITEEQKGRIFNAFEQAEGSTTRNYGGTGLGLPISRKIVDLMGGDLTIKSEPGKGSVFYFTIPLKHGTQTACQSLIDSVDIKGLKILVVDDAKDTRDYCSIIIKNFGIEQCDVAADGFEALEMVSRQKELGEQYNLVFVDWKMPSMDGIELTRRMKKNVEDNTIVIMISVAEWSDIEKEAKEAGVNRFIPKPLFPSTLMNAINEIKGVPANVVSNTDSEGRKEYDFSGYTALLVEDVDINREIIYALMEESGLTIEYAENGQEAMERFQSGIEKYDVILMDIHMPVMNGYEATTAIRAIDNPRAKSVPIVAMTASAFKEDIEKCRAVGMNDHIAKPVNPEELHKTLGKYLYPERALPWQSAEGENDLAERAEDYAVYLPYIDAAAGIKRVMGKEKLYLSLLESCDIQAMSVRLLQAMKTEDTEEGINAAHYIKGVAANLSLPELQKIAGDVEQILIYNMTVGDKAAEFEAVAGSSSAAISRLLADCSE